MLLLDDVWERLDLSEVGIPTLNQDNGCKVVLTTRSLSICQQMETDEEIKVETLTEEQAWHLFKKKVGDVAMFSYIEPIARCIVQECDGLPLAIVVVGSSLRKISEVVMWRNTLRELQLPTTSQIEVMEERVFFCLKSSYERLQDECKKKLFLYCSLYPEDCEILITELAEYCWLEGFIYGVHSIEEARDKGHSMVISLINAALLERCYDEKCVKRHDVVRDFALREARDVLVKDGMDVKHPLEEKEWWQMQKISLMKSSLCSLLERPNCITLSTLLLQGNDQLKMIPYSFFELMQSLTILDLSGTNISSLPPSLFNLVNLRGLYLRDCNELEDLPPQVRELKQLEVLHLGGSTGIKYLPREVGELSGLKRLIVGFRYTHWPWNDDNTEEWKMKRRVPTGIIPSLPLLEELGLCVYGCIEEEQWDDESMKVVVDELCRLEHLTYLDFYFPKEEHLERFLRRSIWGKASWFRRFRFRVGAETTIHSSGQDEAWEGCLIYKGSDEISHVAIMETLAHCSTFNLQEHCATQKLSEFGMENMNELKKCLVKNCDKMETLFDGDDEQETNALLPNMVRLEIHKLPNWRRLWDGPLLPGSLSKLTDLILIDCHRLKKVLQLDIIQQLPSLQRLEVGRSSVEEIIGIEEEMSVPYHAHINSNDRVILPNIKRISLHDLQELVSICQEVSLELPSLEIIRICECPKLRSLSSITHGTNNVPPALKMIVGESEWWEALEWEDNDIKQQLQPFFADLYGR